MVAAETTLAVTQLLMLRMRMEARTEGTLMYVTVQAGTAWETVLIPTEEAKS